MSIAAAQDRAVLVVRARDEPLGAELAEAIASGLSARGIEVRRPSRPAQTPPDDSIERAQAAYHALSPEEALRLLEAWLARREQSGDAGSRERWVDGLVWLGLVRLALGDEGGADAALDRALGVDPGLVLDPVRYPPTLRERLEERRAVPRPMATLRVEAEPAGARVQVDGELRGPAPLEMEVSVGRHLVRVAARGHRPEGRAIDVGAEGARLTLHAPIDPELALIEVGPPGSPLPRATRAAAAALRERVIVLDLTGRARELRALLRDESSERRAVAGPARSAPALASALLVAWDAGAPGLPVPEDPLPWIGLGVGAAVLTGVAIGVAAALATQPSGFSVAGTR